MASRLKIAVGKLNRTYDLLERTAKRKFPTWGRLRPGGAWTAYVEAIESQNWAGLDRAARRTLAESHRILRDVIVARRALAPHFALNARVAVVFQKNFVAPSSRPGWPEARRVLETDLKRRGRSPAEIARFVHQIETMDAGSTPRRHLQSLRAREARLEVFARRAMASLMGAHMARTVAALNQAGRRGGSLGPGAAAFARRTLRMIETAERGFHRTIRRNQIPSVPLGPSASVDRALREAARWAARAALVRQGKKVGSRDDTTALLLGDAIRALLRHVALGYELAWLDAADAASPERSRWLETADKRPFPTAWRAPKEYSIATLAHRPRAVADGTPITLTGTLGPVTIRHIAETPVSSAMVRDRARGLEVVVTAKHRKFDSTGMVGESSVQVSGTWEYRAEETASPALRLGQRRLADLSTRSWTDWVTAQLREIYEPSPQGLTMRWSWEPGRDGAGNPLRYQVWFVDERRPLP